MEANPERNKGGQEPGCPEPGIKERIKKRTKIEMDQKWKTCNLTRVKGNVTEGRKDRQNRIFNTLAYLLHLIKLLIGKKDKSLSHFKSRT